MNEHPEAQDKLHVRGLLAEAGVEESPELVEQLLALRMQSRVPAPEPDGELAALFAGNPVPLRPRAPRGRGIILGAALIGAMAVGAGGVAANPDFLVRADPNPEVTFTPEAPTLERAEPAAPEAVTDPLPPAAVPVPEPAPTVEAVPVPAPVPAPVRAPEPAPAIVPAPGVEPGNPPLPIVGGGPGIVLDPPRGNDLHEGPNARTPDAKRAGADLAGDRGSSRQGMGMGMGMGPGPGSDKGRGNGGANSHGRGPDGRNR